MNPVTAVGVMERLNAIWPQKHRMSDDSYEEWTQFLAEYDGDLAMRALRTLREVCKWPPTMADFRGAYFEVLAISDSARRQLPSGQDDDEGQSLRDRYGSNQDHWVYCWRCDMAVSMDDLEGRIGYDVSRGMYHLSCPRNGSAPTIPAVERAQRDKFLADHKVRIGPHVDPVRYTEERPRRRKP